MFSSRLDSRHNRAVEATHNASLVSMLTTQCDSISISIGRVGINVDVNGSVNKVGLQVGWHDEDGVVNRSKMLLLAGTSAVVVKNFSIIDKAQGSNSQDSRTMMGFSNEELQALRTLLQANGSKAHAAPNFNQ
ncbi:hypothetical protein TSUD_197630 [Trifolium subterraneum]|uniref:Uncharacterized protein n=1 Tax=Trifolium subterraneum TaxID=3900 RepID=A0A2Z6MCU6_TRISU|nr:hypothetical protein TSUD_197630 [Trifolium subterraneum]